MEKTWNDCESNFADSDNRNRKKKLLEGMAGWRRNKPFDDLGKINEATALG